MNRWLRRLAWGVVVLVVVGAPSCYVLALHSPEPGAEFPLDLARIRTLADSIPGDKPSAIRYERVMSMKFREAMLVAGDDWTPFPMQIYAYQLVYPDRTILIDTALSRGMPAFVVGDFDAAAYQRVQAAMERAAQIVITHEHLDHIGGILEHPALAKLRPALRLTAEQLGNPKGWYPAQMPVGPMAGYEPLKYDDLYALAPGVVLIKAPGHTPGSQMVYVKRADGRELLFLGDVSWRMRNIELVRERPLFMTLIIGERRDQVLAQFKALHALREREPGVALVPGHEGRAIGELATAGLLEEGFH